MKVSRDEAEAAYRYAWWLTGDAELAAVAVLSAIESSDLRRTDGEDVRTTLLREVRSCAIDAPTMCPASEVALLHDIGGLPLPVAAELAAVAERDATTELAHGRLEALPGEVDVEILHPERLGGLAVGNPADVAHARQCASCGRMRELLLAGRDEVGSLPSPALPASVVAAEVDHVVEHEVDQEVEQAVVQEDEHEAIDIRDVMAQPVPSRRERRRRRERELAEDPAAELVPHLVVDPEPELQEPEPEPEVREPEPKPEPEVREPEPEPEESPPGPVAEDDARPARTLGLRPASDVEHEAIDVREHMGEVVVEHRVRRRVWGVLAMLALAAAIAIVASRAPSLLPGGAPTEEPTAPAATSEPEPTPTPEPTPEPSGPVDPVSGLRVLAAGLQIDDQLVSDNPTIDPFDPLRVQLDYAGLIANVTAQVVWTAEGVPFREQLVELSARRDTHLFGAPVPDAGWPAGQHVLMLSANGSPLGEVRFLVAPAPAAT